MTSHCPHCQEAVDLGVTHQGVSSDGTLRRALIEAAHSVPVCDEWKASEVDLIVVARG